MVTKILTQHQDLQKVMRLLRRKTCPELVKGNAPRNDRLLLLPFIFTNNAMVF
jgi:hypothetical protein